MKILVTGGAGFIGNHLANKLKALGHDIIINDLSDKIKKEHFVKFGVFDFDISKYEYFENLPIDIDVIYHTAAQTSGYIGLVKPELDVDWNMKGTLNVCRFAKECGVKKVIYTSSMAVYGNGDFFKETDEINPISHYGVSKLCGELYLKLYEIYGMDYTIFRLFNVYGYGQDMENLNQGMVSIYLAQSLNSKTVEVKGSVDRYRDFIYIDDVISALVLGLESKTNGEIYNVSNKRKTTVRELLDLIFKAHRDSDSFKVKNIGQYDGDQDGNTGDNRKLKRLGWKPIMKLEDGIKKFCEDVEGIYIE
tara:strand:- start:242 stop:1159 length:918 start_codon:yes stop_codon:yes gene_type:complete